ncbi:hypothetical protein [uncultured Shewanella sp.]|nr:hypothetical protein [uncultured Shewanella sp.]
MMSFRHHAVFSQVEYEMMKRMIYKVGGDDSSVYSYGGISVE